MRFLSKISKPHKNITKYRKKRKTDTERLNERKERRERENYRTIYLMDIGVKYPQNISKSNPATYKMDKTL